ALESQHDLGAAHLTQFVERKSSRALHQSGDLQSKCGRVDHRMPIVLRGEELVLGSKRPVDGPDVERSPIGRRRKIHLRRQVGEGDRGLALGKTRNRGAIHTAEQRRRCQCLSQRISSCNLVRHVLTSVLALPVFYLPSRRIAKCSPWMKWTNTMA